MKRRLPWVLAGAAALVVLLKIMVFTPDPIPVKAVAVTRGRVESTVTNTKAGTIRARRRSQLSAETGGRIIEITHREGARVEQGEVLLRMNDETQNAQVGLALQTLRTTQALRREVCIARDRAKRELERKRALASQKIVSADVLDQLETASQSATASCKAATARIEEARARLSVARAQLDKVTLRAPFAGVIAEVSVEVGEWITPSPPLLTAPAVIDLIDPTSYYVSAPMDEVDSGSIRTGQPVKITVDSRPGDHFEGHVVRIAPYVLDIEAQNRTVEIEVEFDDPRRTDGLLPGTSTDVEVVLEAHDDVLRIPSSAILDGKRVLIAVNGKLEERKVELGLRNWDFAEVRDGLEPDQQVVVTLDRVEIKPGARVEVETTEYRP